MFCKTEADQGRGREDESSFTKRPSSKSESIQKLKRGFFVSFILKTKSTNNKIASQPLLFQISLYQAHWCYIKVFLIKPEQEEEEERVHLQRGFL